MSKLQPHFKQSSNVLIPSPPLPSHSTNKISPIILLVVVISSIIFIISTILLLLIRFLIKRPFFYTISHSNRYSTDQNPSSNPLQRQLQQLFRLHDSGLDQVLIDALPIFTYKDIIGLKEKPFDCPICLCEFSNQDNLRLLPMCSHAFHITCIDTWLLSNSTCPLCRSSLLTSGFETQELSLNNWREFSYSCSIDSDHNKPTIMEESASERRVFSVRLGKFRSSSNGEDDKIKEEGESSSMSNDNQFDVRRCYSMGSCQYVVSDLNLQVALLNEIGYSSKDEISLVDMDVDGKMISRKNKGDSFSVSKIWLWSKKNKFSGSSQVDVLYGGKGTLSAV